MTRFWPRFVWRSFLCCVQGSICFRSGLNRRWRKQSGFKKVPGGLSSVRKCQDKEFSFTLAVDKVFSDKVLLRSLCSTSSPVFAKTQVPQGSGVKSRCNASRPVALRFKKRPKIQKILGMTEVDPEKKKTSSGCCVVVSTNWQKSTSQSSWSRRWKSASCVGLWMLLWTQPRGWFFHFPGISAEHGAMCSMSHRETHVISQESKR